MRISPTGPNLFGGMDLSGCWPVGRSCAQRIIVTVATNLRLFGAPAGEIGNYTLRESAVPPLNEIRPGGSTRDRLRRRRNSMCSIR